MSDADSSRRFYRLIKTATAHREDFYTHKQLGLPLRSEKVEDLWSRGISVFPSEQDARAMGERIPAFRDGFIICLEIPPGANVRIEQTGRWPHFTIFDAAPEELLGYIKGTAIPVRKQP